MFDTNVIRGRCFQKGILLFLFFLLSIALIISWNTPATGYESSIYESAPLLFWVILFSSAIAGIASVIVSIAKNELDQCYSWKVNFLIIYLCYTICLSLFIIRGYYMWWRGTVDPVFHIEWIKETIITSRVPNDLIYPIMHIYLSEIVLIAGIDPITLHKIMPVIFSILFILYMYVFAKIVFSNTAEALLVTIIGCTIFRTDFYLTLIPNGLSNLLLPLALFVFFKYLSQGRWVWAIPLTILVILYPVFHPVPTIFIGLVFLTLWTPLIIQNSMRYIHDREIAIPNFKSYIFKLILPFSVMLIWFIFWISSFGVWGDTLKSIYQTIFLEGTPSEAMDLLDMVSYAQGYGYNVIEIAIKQYGVVMVVLVLSILAVILILRDYYRQGRYNKPLLTLLGPFGALLVIMPILFLFDLPFNAFRFLHALLILATIFSAYTLYYILTCKRRISLAERIPFASIFVIVIISGLFLGGSLSLYPSPYKLTPSYQITHSEFAGMTFFYENRDVHTPLSGITTPIWGFANLILTPEEIATQHLPRSLKDHRAPWHFGYDNYTSVSFLYDTETDLIITQPDRVFYTDLFPEMAQERLTTQDFDRLKIDPGIDFIYSNGEFDFYKIVMMM
jgi:hypothetical protein